MSATIFRHNSVSYFWVPLFFRKVTRKNQTEIKRKIISGRTHNCKELNFNIRHYCESLIPNEKSQEVDGSCLRQMRGSGKKNGVLATLMPLWGSDIFHIIWPNYYLIPRCDMPLGRCSMFHIAVGCGITIALPQAFTFVVKQKGS